MKETSILVIDKRNTDKMRKITFDKIGDAISLQEIPDIYNSKLALLRTSAGIYLVNFEFGTVQELMKIKFEFCPISKQQMIINTSCSNINIFFIEINGFKSKLVKLTL